ncbi:MULTISPECIES: hypothetical protein [unclassified Acinetobacter]|uniref:hypothetical protein n=1 Tax=unclassified Acinetobacter TaxID=196816 RepID=UPI00244A8797|nr:MULTISPECIES: hypothetical protein [unclassified Acinetobacter]MDH0032563.1 hypothetical protein [Acinetobacter sp. GD04021]MDH0885254.1 hypothetical protein [Acinetobacter sp. GD03873]MDH1084418.1 hypothetical protein [Acinetobacter sp. GD03983]MDH2188306.1 hypothetical protein [Acinetobacter sp. GD03645]MDH2203817.1 hypothetical protein [Acinetobacter sp. GD03647]
MKTKTLALITLSLLTIGCQKQSHVPDPKATAQFEAADKKIGEYLDLLDNPNASKDEQKEVLCEEYPSTYEKDYVPALLKLEPGNYTKEGLQKDFKIVFDSYLKKLDIKCT